MNFKCVKAMQDMYFIIGNNEMERQRRAWKKEKGRDGENAIERVEGKK